MYNTWKEEYKDMNPLSTYQVELLDTGPHSLAQSWLLGAMYSDYVL